MDKAINYPILNEMDVCKVPTIAEGPKASSTEAEKEIERLGFSEQNASLQQLGFRNPKRNLKQLIKFNGDLMAVINKYVQKYDKKEGFVGTPEGTTDKPKRERKHGKRDEAYYAEKDKSLQQEIATAGFEKQNQRLVEAGFSKLKRNLKALKKSKGDFEQALAFLQSKGTRSPKGEKKDDAFYSGEIIKLGFAEQNKKLQELGFTKLKKNLRVLQKFNGDVEAIIKKWQGKVEKNKDKDGKKKERLEKKAKYELVKKEYEAFPDVETVYLDGNNMLFVLSEIRALMLKRNKKDAEKMLAQIAMKFNSGLTGVNTILIFDSTKEVSEQQIIGTNGKATKFLVCSAAPFFQTSDDALVDWASTQVKEPKKTLFVTNDRELRVRLYEKGCQEIMSTGTWFKLAKNAIGEDIYNGITQTPKA